MYCSFIWKPQALRKTQWFQKLGSLSHRPTPPGPRLRFAAARLRPTALGFASRLSGCPCQDKTHPSSYRPQRVSVPLAVTHRTQPLAGGPMGDGSKRTSRGGNAPSENCQKRGKPSGSGSKGSALRAPGRSPVSRTGEVLGGDRRRPGHRLGGNLPACLRCPSQRE